MADQVQKDLQFIWHPFTHLKFAEAPVNIISSKDSYYFDEKGNRYIDAISSWWVNLHGHSHPYIAKKIAEQALQSAHTIFSGFTHPQAINLAERLLQILPDNQKKIFFSDDGSTSVEVALKMALQFFFNRNEERYKIIAFENAYHGDTFGGMSAGARNVFNEPFASLLFDVIHIPVPQKNNLRKSLDTLMKSIKDGNVAAFIFEPLVQGAAGMVMHDAEGLDAMISVCKKTGVICIADEVMTGFGRTGRMFASEYLTEQPDIICMSKGITGGFMPFGVTSCANFIYEAYVQEDRTKTFFHGHSYTANPLACAAANASLDLFETENTLDKINKISEMHAGFAARIQNKIKGWDVRHKGTIIAFEYREEKSHYLAHAGDKASNFLFKKGILIRPLGNIFYLLPPYCITREDLNYIYSVIEEFLMLENAGE